MSPDVIELQRNAIIKDVLTEVLQAGPQLSIELADYAYRTGERPSNIGLGTYSQQIAAARKGLNTASNCIDDFFVTLAYTDVFFETFEGIYDNCQNSEKFLKISWDAMVDVTFLSVHTYAAMSLGAAIGTAIPIPVVGTLVGMTVGFAAGIVFDYCGQVARTEIKSWYGGQICIKKRMLKSL